MADPSPPRRAWLHIPVVQLVVPSRWQVGRVVFEPPGSLEKLVARKRPKDPAQAQFSEWAQEGIRSHSASTAAVPVMWPDDSKGQKAVREQAGEEVRDALAVLSLFKHSRYRVATDIQEFGLAGDIGSAMQWTTTTRGRRIIATGTQLVGIIGEWTFRPEDPELFHSDKRFALLDAALRRRVRRSEVERRVLTAIRVRALSTAMLRPQLQVILLATALEALLAEEVPAGERRPRGEFFRIAQRAAYLFCGEPDHRYPSRPPCFYLQAKSEAAMERAFDDRVSRGQDPRCSAFGHVFGLLEDRNEALHLARDSFEKGVLSWHSISTDEVILYFLRWATERGARHLAALDSELEAFVRVGRAVPLS